MKAKTKGTKPKTSSAQLTLEKLQAEIKALEKQLLNRPRYDEVEVAKNEAIERAVVSSVLFMVAVGLLAVLGYVVFG